MGQFIGFVALAGAWLMMLAVFPIFTIIATLVIVGFKLIDN